MSRKDRCPDGHPLRIGWGEVSGLVRVKPFAFALKIEFACYKFSAALISAGIRWWTHSLYSHTAIVVDGVVYEAVGRGFVAASNLAENHDPGTFVDLFEYARPLDTDQAASFVDELKRMVGMKYDSAGIASFVTGGVIPENPCRVFCSEAAQRAAIVARAPLQHLKAASMFPRDVAMSLALRFTKTVQL